MEKLYEHNQKAVGGNKRKAFMGGRYSYCSLVALCLISGCASLKKAAIVGGAAGLGATAGSVISGGAIAPILGSATGASVASVATSGMGNSETLEVTGDATIIQEAPSNFFSLLQQLVEMGGWLLILVILVPMVLGWILPGPLEKRKKKP